MRKHGTHLSDFEEMELGCHDRRVKPLIAEAIACYKAGAYRACIVSTWICFLYDFNFKLAELKDKGHGDATTDIDDFQAHFDANDLAFLQEWERTALEKCRDRYNFLTQTEFDELDRLRLDRHRCAHSLSTMAELFHPSAEQARYHLRNVFDFMLSEPPVEGRAALDGIWRFIEDATFPTDVANARNVLMTTPLGFGVRDVVWRELSIGVASTSLIEPLNDLQRAQHLAALAAMRLMNEPLVDQYLQERLSDKVSGLDNTTRPRVISLLRAVPTAWEFLSTFQQEQMRTIVNTIDITIPANVEIVAAAAHVTGLRELAKRRLSTLDNAQLADLATRYASEEIYDVAISEFEGIGAYADAAPSLRILVLPFVAHFSLDQVRRVLNAFRNNDQIYGAHFYMGPPMVDLLQNAPHAAQLETDWREIKRMLSAGHFVNEPQWNSFRERLEEAFPG